MFYSSILWYAAFMQRPRGLRMCVRKERKLRVCLLDQLLWHLELNLANSNILLHKRRIKGLRAAPEINEGPLHFQNHSRQKRHFTLCFEKDLLKNWQQKHNELNAQWDEVWVAKCLHQFLWQKQSLISRQLPSNDSPRTGSSLSLPSITSAGTKGKLPKGMKIRAICIYTQTIEAQQSHCDSLSISLYHNCHPNDLQKKW